MTAKEYLLKEMADGDTWVIENGKNRSLLSAAAKKGYIAKKKSRNFVYYTTRKIEKMERFISETLVKHEHKPLKTFYNIDVVNEYIRIYEMTEGISLDEMQKEAIRVAVNNNLFILTGGPGTGKTCVTKGIIYCLKYLCGFNDIKLSAPTGKAARRMTESIGMDACTVQKRMHLTDEDAEPTDIEGEVLILDEISMLDTKTTYALCKALDRNTRLILIGDIEQLPSVGNGSVLRDLIYSGLPSVELTKTFRQASESGLFANILNTKSGLLCGFEERDDFKVISCSSSKDAKAEMEREFIEGVKEYGLENVVCLTPYRRKGDSCAIKMNNSLQNALNKSPNGITYTVKEEDGFEFTQTIKVNDPVMQLVNREEVANGDVGKVINVNGDEVTVKYIDCEVTYIGEEELQEITLAYAMSIHKSQGSEYKLVITSSISSDEGMLSRNTIYTAITRAKQKCVMITDKDTAKTACKIESGYQRTTMLREFILEAEDIWDTYWKYL